MTSYISIIPSLVNPFWNLNNLAYKISPYIEVILYDSLSKLPLPVLFLILMIIAQQNSEFYTSVIL